MEAVATRARATHREPRSLEHHQLRPRPELPWVAASVLGAGSAKQVASGLSAGDLEGRLMRRGRTFRRRPPGSHPAGPTSPRAAFAVS